LLIEAEEVSSAMPQRMDFKALAKARIAEAEAAIAAAEKSAMSAYSVGSFRKTDAPSVTAPWVASPSPTKAYLKESSTFEERLRKHEAHLSTIKQACGAFSSTSSLTHRTSAPLLDRPAGNQALPPWSQPQQLPSFGSYKAGANEATDAAALRAPGQPH
jgi:hypothetical protein